MMKILMRGLLRILFRVRVHGGKSQFQAQRLLIIANHESFLDGLLLGVFLPVNPVFVVHTGITQHWLGRILLFASDYLAIDTSNPMALKKIIKLVESGRPIVIFPEGRLTTTGSMMKIYEGPAFVAAKTGATIIPVRLDGPARTYLGRLSGEHPRRLFPRISLYIQPATQLPMPEAATAKLRRRKAGEELRKIMQTMLFNAYPQTTLYTGLLDAISIYGRRRRLVEDVSKTEYCYGQLLKMALALGRMTAKLTRENENVGVLLPNLASTISLVIGMSTLQRVPAMLNYSAGIEGMQNACVAANIQTIITSKTFLQKAKLEAQVTALENVRIVYLEDLRSQFGLLDKLWLLGFALWLPRWVEKVKNTERAAVVLFTSGSEGKPKGVVLSHRAILANIAQVKALVDFSIEDKILNALPVFHAFGLVPGALLPIMTGTKLFLYPSPLHYRVIPEVAYDRNCTILFGTNTFLANYGKFAHPYDFHRLRYVLGGAEKLSDQVRNLWIEKFGIRILEGYGATEAAPLLAVNTAMNYRKNTVGQLVPGMDAQVIAVPQIEHGGLLHVRGPNLMSGYYRFDNPGVIEPPHSEAGPGWYNTGDVVEIDEDGFISIIGRIKRFAKIAGEMVSLEIVEKIAGAASPGFQHAASSQPDVQRGETIVLFTHDKQLTREQLQTAARNLGHPELAISRKIVHLTELPLLATGKLDYVRLKKLAETA